jgi:thymidylate synthase (FAD)
MKARLIGYTQPTADVLGDINDAQDLIAYAARVSNPSNQINSETSERLLTYLIKHKHWSPFEMASATMEIETTRDIARQMLRHRSFAFQEFSQRYADPAAMGEQFVIREARLQDEKNRQNSVEMDLTDPDARETNKIWIEKQQDVIRAAKDAYTWAVSNGIAKEQARAVLPEGNTVSRLYMQGSIRSWIHYIELRSGHGTQKEHIELAREIGKAIVSIFPMTNQFIN